MRKCHLPASCTLLPLASLPLQAKALMQGAGVPVVPGYQGEDQSEHRLQASRGLG